MLFNLKRRSAKRSGNRFLSNNLTLRVESSDLGRCPSFFQLDLHESSPAK